MNNQPIGIFDSGIGGLSILREINSILPNEDLLYIGDTAYLPYGTKSKKIITERANQICEYLISKKCKSIVVACNTATSAAIHELRINFSAPIIGIEPAIKPATQNTKSRIIGILATQATLEGDKLSILKQKFGQDITILHQSCLGLVEEIELGNQQSQDLENLIKIYVRPLIEQGADTLVLGCSHYPLVRALIQKYAGDDVTILDPSLSVAYELQRQLAIKKILRESNSGTTTCSQTGDSKTFEMFIKKSRAEYGSSLLKI
jgi:glutamate racemase